MHYNPPMLQTLTTPMPPLNDLHRKEADHGSFVARLPALPTKENFTERAKPWIGYSKNRLVVFSNTLQIESLNLLLNEQVSALCIKGFYPKDLSHVLARWIKHHPDRQVYGQNAIDPETGKVQYIDYHVDRVGPVRNALIGKPLNAPEWDDYLTEAAEKTTDIRRLTVNRHPIELLIKQLDSVWKFGAEKDQVNGNELCAGIGRVTRPGEKTLIQTAPHVDGPWPCKLHFGVNVYLAIPNVGGELETFGGPTLTHDQMSAVTSNHDFRAEYGESEFVKPGVGDLIIVNTRRPHAVNGFPYGPRISMSAFMMYDKDKPLRFYS